MLYLWRLIAIFILMVLAVNAYSAEQTAEDFLQECIPALAIANGKEKQLPPLEFIHGIRCFGYLAGVADMIGFFPPKINGRQIVCLPNSGISGDQEVRIVVKWLRGHPESLNQNAREQVVLAFAKAFPCSKK